MKRRKMLAQQNMRTVLLITSTAIYMLLGAAVFSALEFDEHIVQKTRYNQIYDRLLTKYNMSVEDVEELADYLHKRRHLNFSLEPWSFAGSVYFTSVTITTIGRWCLLKHLSIVISQNKLVLLIS